MKEILDTEREEESQWVSISDLMSVLMMIFLFIAVTYMLNVMKEKEKIEEIAVSYNRLQNELYDDLDAEFKKDLEDWNAVIDKSSLSVRFQAPEVLFTAGSASLQPKFRDILRDFFPRYIAIISAPKYRADIEEIRIEGHTSTEGRSEMTSDQAYYYNMKLSQDRTRNVLEFVLSLGQIREDRIWIRENLTANGLSSSKTIRIEDVEDKEKSRRVEFRIRTNAEKSIVKILSEK